MKAKDLLHLSKEDLIYNTDYSEIELIDFSIESFKYFDKFGIKFLSDSYGITGDIVSVHEGERTFFSELDSLFENISLETNFNQGDVHKEFTNIKRCWFDSSNQVKYDFLLDFYKENKDFKKLLKIIHRTGWISSYNNDGIKVGSGTFNELLERQANAYARIYLKINLGKNISLNKNIDTILNKNQSPLLYKFDYSSVMVTKKNMSHFDFYDFKKGNNDKIKTFENIESIGGFSLTYNYGFRSLGSIKKIQGDCYMKNSEIQDLGNLNSVKGDLIINNCNNILTLDNIQVIGGNLNLRSSEINEIHNLKVKGNLILNKKFKDNHTLNNCTIGGAIKFYNPIKR